MAEPRIIHPNLQLIDITDRFVASAQQIPTGQLIKDNGFTLFEAVGALEIGDPKMDSGALEDGEDLVDDFDVSQPISPEQVIWIIDQLLYREVSWHQGYPLAQTLFTSIYLDKLLWPEPKQLHEAHFLRSWHPEHVPSPAQDLLRAYCLGVVKCCDLVLSMVTSQHYYEEEDFATQVYNRDMLRRVPADEVLSVMTQARMNFEDQAQSLEYHNNLLDRLDFRTDFLMLLREASSGNLVSGVDNLLVLVKNIRESQPLGKPLHEAFSIKIQRRLASSVPPRPMVACSSHDAFSFMERFVRDIPAALEMLDVTSATDLHTAFWTFMSQVPAPCVYIRSLAQSFLTLHDRMMGHANLEEFVVADMRALVLPASVLLDSPVESPADPRFQIGLQMKQFVQKVAPSFQNQFRSFALNRPRVRRNLCHAAVEWDNIQADAEEIDGYLQTLLNEKPLPYGPSEEPAFAYLLSSWVYHHKLTQLHLLIQMGFELDIYAPPEFVDMYWYLSSITGLHLSHLERITYFIAQAKPLPHWTLEEHRSESQKSLSLLYRHFSWLKATDTLASALQRIFVVLARHGHLGKSGPTYSSDELRHEVRMRPFQPLSVPEPIPHGEMKLMARLGTLSDREVLDQAARLAMASRKSWDQVLKDQWHFQPLLSDGASSRDSVFQREWTVNVKNSMKACIGASIAITTLTKALVSSLSASGPDDKGSSAIAALKISIAGPDDSDRFHRWWAVPRVVK